MSLFYLYASQNDLNPNELWNDACLVGYADAGYMSDPHKVCSQTGYVFTITNTTISWRSTKHILVATSSNHAELICPSRGHSWMCLVKGRYWVYSNY